jgi:hypothetical protein
MRRKKKSKRGIIDEDLPTVSESNAKRQVIYGTVGFVVSLTAVVLVRPGTDHLLEMLVVIGVVASSTLGSMKLASWLETKQWNIKG